MSFLGGHKTPSPPPPPPPPPLLPPSLGIRLEKVRLTLSVTFTDTPCVMISLLTVATSLSRAADSSCVATCAYQSTLYTQLTHIIQLHLFHLLLVILGTTARNRMFTGSIPAVSVQARKVPTALIYAVANNLYLPSQQSVNNLYTNPYVDLLYRNSNSMTKFIATVVI